MRTVQLQYPLMRTVQRLPIAAVAAAAAVGGVMRSYPLQQQWVACHRTVGGVSPDSLPIAAAVGGVRGGSFRFRSFPCARAGVDSAHAEGLLPSRTGPRGGRGRNSSVDAFRCIGSLRRRLLLVLFLFSGDLVRVRK